MVEEHVASMMENLCWWGIPVFFRALHAGAEGQDIALVGVPHSTGNGTTERDQLLNPRAVRNASAVQRRLHGGIGVDPWNALKFADVDRRRSFDHRRHRAGAGRRRFGRG